PLSILRKGRRRQWQRPGEVCGFEPPVPDGATQLKDHLLMLPSHHSSTKFVEDDAHDAIVQTGEIDGHDLIRHTRGGEGRAQLVFYEVHVVLTDAWRLGERDLLTGCELLRGARFERDRFFPVLALLNCLTGQRTVIDLGATDRAMHKSSKQVADLFVDQSEVVELVDLVEPHQ